MHFYFIPKTILKILIFNLLLLSIGNIFSIISIILFKQERFGIIVTMFNFNLEWNVPTLFSFLILLTCSLLTYYISAYHKQKNEGFKYWLFLSALFLFLSLDETLLIHERIGRKVKEYYPLSGYFYYAWVLPYGILSTLLFFYFRDFLIQLPYKIRKLFLVSGFIFITGALGFEMMGGNIDYQLGTQTKFNLVYNILYSIEETLEMLGIILFIYTLLEYIASNKCKSLIISFKK